MKINKIICDICNKEIDINIDEALAMFEHIQVKQKINFMPNLLGRVGDREPMKTDKELVKTSFDLCKNCAKETEDFFTKQKEEKIVSQSNNKGRENNNKNNKTKEQT